MASDEGHRRYYECQLESQDEFFRRFNAEPAWCGRSVLDFGCGHGAMSVRAAERGAAHVVGVDLDTELIAWAASNVRDMSGISDRVRFTAADIATIDEQFEIIVSKDSLEHVSDVSRYMRLLADHLTFEGTLWLGFSPFYYSPRGDHGRLRLRLPWMHTLPWPLVRRLAPRTVGRPITCLLDVGLNGLTPSGFRGAVKQSGLTFRRVSYNAGDKLHLAVLAQLRPIPGIERYVTVSAYAVVQHAEYALTNEGNDFDAKWTCRNTTSSTQFQEPASADLPQPFGE